MKVNLIQQCSNFLDERHKNITHTISALQEALQSETKSTAGDKHETGRAMVQLEREKTGAQLAELQKIIRNFKAINFNTSSNKVVIGSLVYTTQANYFIAISAGALNYKQTRAYAISPQTPMAKALLSKKVGDKLMFRNDGIRILKIE